MKELELMQENLEPVWSTPKGKGNWLSSGTKRCLDFTTAATAKYFEDKTDLKLTGADRSTTISQKSLDEWGLDDDTLVCKNKDTRCKKLALLELKKLICFCLNSIKFKM